MISKEYADFSWEQTVQLLSIDSPTGFTDYAAAWIRSSFAVLGFDARLTAKGGVLVDLGGQDSGSGLMLTAHTDTLGAMVAEVKGDGRLRLTPLGGMNANNAEAENVRVYTRGGKIYEGTFQLCNASVHVNDDYNAAKRSFSTMEVVLDAEADSAEAAQKLGIQVGDIVCFSGKGVLYGVIVCFVNFFIKTLARYFLVLKSKSIYIRIPLTVIKHLQTLLFSV